MPILDFAGRYLKRFSWASILLPLQIWVRHLWKRSCLFKLHQTQKQIPCPSYFSKEVSFFLRRMISGVDHLWLFTGSSRLSSQLFAAESKILPFFSRWKQLVKQSLERGILETFVDYLRCQDCDLVPQNFPHSPSNTAKYFEESNQFFCEETQNDSGMMFGGSDKRWVYQREPIAKAFIEFTRLPPGEKILEVGGAEGIASKFLEEMGLKVYCLGPAKPMATYARKKLHLKNVVCQPYFQNHFPEKFFDWIYSHHVIEHLIDLNQIFRAFAFHLKPGGHLFLQCPCLDNAKAEMHLREMLCGGHNYGFSESFLSRKVAQASLHVIDIRHTPCDLASLPLSFHGKFNTSAWADDPGGITICAKKPG